MVTPSIDFLQPPGHKTNLIVIQFEQLKKQKDKSKKPGGSKKKDDQQESKDDSREAGASEDTEPVIGPPLANADVEPIQDTSELSEKEAAVPETVGSDESVQTPSKQTHNRQPSLSLQSQLRSSSFRRTSVSQAPTSPSLNGGRSPNLPVLSPEGDSLNEIYRKQASRLEELERENRRLAKDARENEARWKKTEEELEELRESSGEVAELKLRAGKVDAKSEEIEKLVRLLPVGIRLSRVVG